MLEGAGLLVVHELPIGEAFEAGQLARRVQMARDGTAAVELYDLALVEDDGPGSRLRGEWWPSLWQTVGGAIRVKKVLHVDRTEARRVRLVLAVTPKENETAALDIRVNGEVASCPARDGVRQGPEGDAIREWRMVTIPAAWLRRGDNEIELSCAGEAGWWLSTVRRADIEENAPERRHLEPRSHQSRDGGKTWTRKLGDEGTESGEYMVRLNLDQYAAEGELVGPVVDLAEKTGSADVAGAVRVKEIRVSARGDVPVGTRMDAWVRTGSSPVVERGSWSGWQKCGDGTAKPADASHRFTQWRVVLATKDGRATPRLEGVRLEAEVEPVGAAWGVGLRVKDVDNPSLRYTSIPFEYEHFNDPALVELRETYKLDEVVAGAKDEFEAMRRLRFWVGTRWSWAPPQMPYPKWDAREILTRKDGMCVQFAIAFMQCALALGRQARFTFGIVPSAKIAGKDQAGHEVAEYWSNDLGKWVYMDPNHNDLFLEAETGEPADMLRMHEATLDVYFGGGRVPYGGVEFDAIRKADDLRMWKKDEPAPEDGPATLCLKWAAVHWMPRNNFFAHRFPEPIAQGRVGWSWPGYWSWDDERTGRWPWLANYTRRRSDIDWTINLVRFAATRGEKAGRVDVRMGTVTPDFEMYEVRVDGGAWCDSPATVAWDLKAGENRLEMRVRNRAGVVGKASRLVVEWDGRA